MVPQALDQKGNAKIIEKFGVGITLDQKNVSDSAKFITDVSNTLQNMMSNWKLHRKEAVDLSTDMKNSEDFNSAIEKIENMYENNELIVKPLNDDKTCIWKIIGCAALLCILIIIIHKIYK